MPARRCVPVCLLWLAALAGARAAEEIPTRPARDGFRFVQLSDLHCARARTNPPPRFPFDPHRKDLVHSFALLEAAVREINESVKPDFVVITGDLVERGRDRESLARVKAALDKLACPYYPVIGDHESRAAWAEVFGPERLNYTFRHGGWRFIAADASPGALDKATLAWLEGELGADAATPTALLVHRPLVVPDLYIAAAREAYGVPLLLGNAAEVRERLLKAGNVRAVFAGHCHVGIECKSPGLSHYVAPALVGPGNSYRIVEMRGTVIRTELRALGAPVGLQQPRPGVGPKRP